MEVGSDKMESKYLMNVQNAERVEAVSGYA